MTSPTPIPSDIDDSGRERAVAMDQTDGLAPFRDRFEIADEGLTYLDGNSLGRQPTAVASLLREVSEGQWAERLIRGWNDGWWDLQLELGSRLSPLLGASPDHVMVSDSTTVNLYKLAAAALDADPGRRKIVTDDTKFPTDLYVLAGLAKQRGMELVIVDSGAADGPFSALDDAIDEDTALVSLSHTSYISGYTYDMAEINRRASTDGALTLWDLSHSVGAMPIDLAGSGADLATGCTYKYLNGGPGSPAFLYVDPDLLPRLHNPIRGWWAHEAPFAMSPDFTPTEGIRRFHVGTMPILSTAAIGPGLDLTLEAGIDAIREKSVAMTSFFVDLYDLLLADIGFGLVSPRDPDRRGSHVTISHDEAWHLTNALIEIGQVIPDFRAPDRIRFGFAPLYNTFEEVHQAAAVLHWLVESGEYKRIDPKPRQVT